MIKYTYFFILVIFSSACTREPGCFDEELNQDEARIDCGGPCEACPAEYPEIGPWGLNLLADEDTLFTSAEELSLSVTIPQGTTLNVELRLIDGSEWFYTDNDGWTVNDYAFNRQLFFAAENGSSNLRLIKGLSPVDTIQVNYFENNSAQTLRKIVVWEQ